MCNFLGIGTNRGYSMIGLGIGLGIGEFRLGSAYGPPPAIDWDFANNRAFGYGIGPTPSFSRASTGYQTNSDGSLTSKAIDAARFQYVYSGGVWVSRGLLIEGQATELYGYSSDFSNAAWGKSNCTVTADNTTAPDGTSEADKLVFTSAGYVYQSPGYGNTGNHVGSVWLKADSAQTVLIRIANDSGSESSAATCNVTTSWQRFSVTVNYTVNPTKLWFGIDQRTAVGGPNVAATVYAWGADVETGTTPSTTISSSGAGSVVRSADVALVSGAGFSGIWNATEGTFVVEGVTLGSGTATLLAVDDDTANEQMRIYTSGTDPKFTVTDGGATQADLDGGTITASTPFKFAVSYKANSFKACLNGGTVQSDVSGTLPTVNRLRLGVDKSGNYLNGTLARVRYYATQLTDTQHQVLTT